MSTSTTPPAPAPVVPPGQREIRVYSHSTLFYWWPVWAVGFIMAILTLVDGHRMALVPAGTKAEANRPVEGHEAADVLIAPKGRPFPRDENNEIIQPRLHIAQNKSYGVLYATILLLTIVVSCVPLRGLWSLIIVLCIVLLVVIFALFGWWDQILEKLNLIDIRINMGGYLFISTILLIIW